MSVGLKRAAVLLAPRGTAYFVTIDCRMHLQAALIRVICEVSRPAAFFLRRRRKRRAYSMREDPEQFQKKVGEELSACEPAAFLCVLFCG